MHTYRKTHPLGETVYEVGYWKPTRGDTPAPSWSGEWVVLSVHDSERAALRMVNFLNGGMG
jgi:hypothetical protein